MKSVYELVLEFKQRHPFTIAWRLKQNSSVIERHLNSDERVLYAFVAQKNNNTIHLIPESKEDLVLQLQTLFKKHVIYSELKQRGVESFDYVYFQKIFQSSYNDVNIKEKTKEKLFQKH